MRGKQSKVWAQHLPSLLLSIIWGGISAGCGEPTTSNEEVPPCLDAAQMVALPTTPLRALAQRFISKSADGTLAMGREVDQGREETIFRLEVIENGKAVQHVEKPGFALAAYAFDDSRAAAVFKNKIVWMDETGNHEVAIKQATVVDSVGTEDSIWLLLSVPGDQSAVSLAEWQFGGADVAHRFEAPLNVPTSKAELTRGRTPGSVFFMTSSVRDDDQLHLTFLEASRHDIVNLGEVASSCLGDIGSCSEFDIGRAATFDDRVVKKVSHGLCPLGVMEVQFETGAPTLSLNCAPFPDVVLSRYAGHKRVVVPMLGEFAGSAQWLLFEFSDIGVAFTQFVSSSGIAQSCVVEGAFWAFDLDGDSLGDHIAVIDSSSVEKVLDFDSVDEFYVDVRLYPFASPQ